MVQRIMRGQCNCRSLIKEYCQQSLVKLEEMRIQILDFCAQRLNVDPQNIIIQQTQQRQSHQLQPITQINERSQQNQSQFYVRNIRNQSEVGGDQQGQNQFLVERQIEEIRQTCKRDKDRNERFYESQLTFYQNQIDRLLKESSENGVKEEIRKAKEKQKQYIKKIKYEVNQFSEFVKRNHLNIWENGLDQIFKQHNQEISNIFENYSNGFEQNIKERASLRNEIQGLNKAYNDLEHKLEKLKQQNQDYQDQLSRREGFNDQLERQLQILKRELEQKEQDNQAIQLQILNQEALYSEQLRQKNSQIEILKQQSNNSQIEFFNRQNEIKTFFQTIASTIYQIKQNAPVQ